MPRPETHCAVRPGREGDLAGIAAIYNHFIETTAISFNLEPVDMAERQAWFAGFAERGPHRLLVAEGAGGSVLGFAHSAPFRSKAAYCRSVEVTVYVHPERGRGRIGSLLYAPLIAALREAGMHRAYALIAKPNSASEAFHARFGFREVGVLTEVGHKFGRYWDVGYWQLAL